MKRQRGTVLEDAFIYMTDSQIKDVADEVAAHVKTLTQHTSKVLETVDHSGVGEEILVGLMPLKEAIHTPSWVRRRSPRFTPEELQAHQKEISNMESIPDPGPEFVLYNTGLTPYDISVYPPCRGEKCRLAEVSGWERTGYWPRYWVAVCPSSSGIYVVRRGNDERWAQYLSQALVRAGFEDDTKEWFSTFCDASQELRHERAGQEYHDWIAAVRLKNLSNLSGTKAGYLALAD
ncbi:MAG: hypothetical protein Q9187_006232 [Circinaria calcarea]